MFSIDKNPLCSDVEDLNNAISQEPEDKPLVLSLARHTNVNFFTQTWIAQLLAHLAQREGGLVIRDAYDRWIPMPRERFMDNIDGVATLVYSHIVPQVGLENVKQEIAPEALYVELNTKLKKTSKLEEQGQTRTFIAIDPDHSTPIEFSAQSGSKKFKYIVQDIMNEFNYKFEQKPQNHREMEIALHSFIYEVFQNTIEHGRYSEGGGLIPGLRYLRIRTYIDEAGKLRRRAEGFPELERFISRYDNNEQKTLRFMELSVSDGGQGIVSHYINSSYSSSAENFDKRKDILHQLIGTRKTSKDKLSGVGLGLLNAMKALSELKAFISLRTEEFWMCRDFNDSDETEQIEILRPVSTMGQINRLRGTQFNVVTSIST